MNPWTGHLPRGRRAVSILKHALRVSFLTLFSLLSGKFHTNAFESEQVLRVLAAAASGRGSPNIWPRRERGTEEREGKDRLAGRPRGPGLPGLPRHSRHSRLGKNPWRRGGQGGRPIQWWRFREQALGNLPGTSLLEASPSCFLTLMTPHAVAPGSPQTLNLASVLPLQVRKLSQPHG